MSKTKPTTIAEYIDSAPKEAQKNLRELYAILAGATLVLGVVYRLLRERDDRLADASQGKRSS